MILKNLRKLREDEGITQEQAGKLFGVSTSTYVYWELGKYQPSIETLVALADHFHTTIDYIVGREIKDFTPEEMKILKMAADIIEDKAKAQEHKK